jgi:hypothetical protein
MAFFGEPAGIDNEQSKGIVAYVFLSFIGHEYSFVL